MSFWVFNNLGEFFPHSIHNKADEPCVSILTSRSEPQLFSGTPQGNSTTTTIAHMHEVRFTSKPVIVGVSLWKQ